MHSSEGSLDHELHVLEFVAEMLGTHLAELTDHVKEQEEVRQSVSPSVSPS